MRAIEEKRSGVDGFRDVSEHACTRNLHDFFGTTPQWKSDGKEIQPFHVETYVRTLGPENAERINRILNSVPRRKKHRDFALQYCDMIQKERYSSTYRDAYSDRHIKIKEPRRRSLDIAGPSGKEKINAMKEANDQRRLDKLAAISRGVRWVKGQYENTLCSEAMENFPPIDLSQIERHKLPNSMDSTLGVSKQERQKKIESRKKDPLGSKPSLARIEKSEQDLLSRYRFVTNSMPTFPQGPLVGQKTLDPRGGEGAKQVFGCGFGADKWKSESRTAWINTEGRMAKRGCHKARGFCQNVDYLNEDRPEGTCLWNNDIFPSKNQGRRTFP